MLGLKVSLCMMKNGLFLAVLFLLVASTYAQTPYNVHWMEGGSYIEKSLSSQPLNIYCYNGKSKSFIYPWQSILLRLDIKTDNFNLYEGPSPNIVWNLYKTDSLKWTPSFFSSQKSRIVSLCSYNTTCVAVSTDESYIIHLDIQKFDYVKVSLFAIGVILFLYSKSLSGNSLFFYAIGVTTGVCASFMVVVYFISKMLPGKPIVYSSMVGGWAVGLYFFQFIWSNFQPLLVSYKDYVIWYTVIMAFISFIVCYKIGPPKDERNKNIISWTLQGVGLILMYFSINLIEMMAGISVILFIIKYTPRKWINAISLYWRSKFPPKRVLLTEEQFYEEGLRETAKALEDLRGYCSSPECNQWELMLKLKDPSRFAKFMSGDQTHVTDIEFEKYGSSDFVIRRPNANKRKLATDVSSTLKEDNFTSDDSSSDSEDDELIRQVAF